MAYNPNEPPRLAVARGVDNSEAGCAIWQFTSPIDALSTVLSPGYISNGQIYGMGKGDLVIVYDFTNNVLGFCQISALNGFYAVNLTSLTAGGAGSGITSQNIVVTGTTGPLAALNSFNGWNSSTAGAKTQPIPTATGSLAEIVITDIFGNATTYPITAVPVAGSIVGVNQVYSNGGTITLLDTSAGWVSY